MPEFDCVYMSVPACLGLVACLSQPGSVAAPAKAPIKARASLQAQGRPFTRLDHRRPLPPMSMTVNKVSGLISIIRGEWWFTLRGSVARA